MVPCGEWRYLTSSPCHPPLPSDLRARMFSLLQGTIAPHAGQLTVLLAKNEESSVSMLPIWIGDENQVLHLTH